MNKGRLLIGEVAVARKNFLALVENISETKAAIKMSAEEWSIMDITEHLFWAEQGAILGMWKVLYEIRDCKRDKIYESDHQGWSIEKLIALTWKEKEIVPAVSAPRLGGTLAFWRLSLASLQPELDAFGKELAEDELRLQAQPHAISGAMDFQQRLEFLCFHIKRHQAQVQHIIDRLNSLS